MKRLAFVLLVFLSTPASAQSVVAARMIRAQEIIKSQDVALGSKRQEGAFSDPAKVVGLEARRIIYPGRPIMPRDVGPVSIVRPNDLVIIRFRKNGLSITAEGRALGRAASGETLRVMNTMSRSTVIGLVTPDGTVEVR